SDVAAIASEDHYCRVFARDGASRLIYARFADLAEEVAGLDGAVVRRGQWVAADAVRSIRREKRRWVLVLATGGSVAIAASIVPELRRRGWIGANGASALAIEAGP
ncbi:MAG TPA: LytTR family transcriptional regulator DNA-binding domain-containing protein, partial [Propylenella sp.]|nr:LytTR family transcriptional regulator DNA-binding domain-containing protein [Propylenella sp.]